MVVQAWTGKANVAEAQGQAEEVTPRLRVLAPLAEDLSSVTSAHKQQLNHCLETQFWGLCPLLVSTGTTLTCPWPTHFNR